ncbi:MAG TPA: hypothetical protein ENH82_03730 [bacterium]|nr:hypothetical protein [bacterium]
MKVSGCLMTSFIVLIVVFISEFFCCNQASATPESRATMLFLLISPSARVNGMGQAGVALTDETGGYYNPAAPALVSKSNYVGITSYLDKMKWLPALADDITYSYSAAQIGFNKKVNKFGFNSGDVSIPLSISGAFAYYRTKLDLGEQHRTTAYSPDVIATFHSYEKADNFVLSAAAHSIFDIGVGLTIKKLTSKLGVLPKGKGIATGTAYDFGILARFPIVDFVKNYSGSKVIFSDYLSPVLDISTGISWNNRGDEVYYIDPSKSDPLPANRKSGVAGCAGISYDGMLKFDFFKVTGSYERYIPQISGIHIEKNASDNKKGIEYSLFEIFQIRNGQYDDNDGYVHLKTRGYTIKSDGIFKLLTLILYHDFSPKINYEKSMLKFLSEHFSISWTEFEYESYKEWNPVDDINHGQLTVMFNI